MLAATESWGYRKPTCLVNGVAIGCDVFDSDDTRDACEGSQSEHETQGNSFPTAQIQPLQLKNWKKHDREVLKYTKSCPSIDQSLGIDALSDNFSIPYGAHGDTLEGDDEEEGGAVTDHENHEYLTNKSESLAGEYTEVEQEDGHFGEGLNDNIEKLHSIKDLKQGNDIRRRYIVKMLSKSKTRGRIYGKYRHWYHEHNASQY